MPLLPSCICYVIRQSIKSINIVLLNVLWMGCYERLQLGNLRKYIGLGEGRHKLSTFYILSRIAIFCNTFMNEYDIWTCIRGSESEIVVYDFIGEIVGTKWKNRCTRLCEVIAGCISDERYFVILNKMFTISILTKEMRKAWIEFYRELESEIPNSNPKNTGILVPIEFSEKILEIRSEGGEFSEIIMQ